MILKCKFKTEKKKENGVWRRTKNVIKMMTEGKLRRKKKKKKKGIRMMTKGEIRKKKVKDMKNN